MQRCAGSNTALFRIGSDGYQANVSTFQDAARANPRIQGAQPHARWPQSAAQPARQRAPPSRAVAAGGKRLGLNPARRLRRKVEFEGLLRGGVRRSLDGFIFYLGTRQAGPPRLGMLISRKHAARATVRNGIKRCIREAFRLEQEKLGSIDLLVRPPLGTRPSARLTERLRGLLNRLAR
jgi:ribonuclease P protein component